VQRWELRKFYKYSLFFLLLSPLILYLALFFLYPLALLFYLSLTKFDYISGVRHFVGLTNYIDILQDPETYLYILRTFLYTLVVVSFSFLLGLGYSIFVYSIKSRIANTMIRMIIVLPMLIMPVAGAVIWSFLLSSHYGWINFLLESLGFQRQVWLLTPYAFWWVMLVDIWGWSPYVFLIMYASLQQIPQSVLEASELDGATSFKKYRYIVLPILKPLIYITLTLKTIDTYRAFDYIWVMTGGGPGRSSTTLNIITYITAIQLLNFEKASAYGVLTMLFPFLFIVFYLIFWKVKRIE